MIRSVQTSDEQIILDLLKLHSKVGYIHLDPTYSKGVFYKNIQSPIIKSDLSPIDETVFKSDFTDLSFIDDGTIDSIVFDPPFVISGKTYKNNVEGSSRIAKRFTGYYSWTDIKESYDKALSEMYRIMSNDAVLLFKCQDTVSSGKNHFTHVYVMNSAVSRGFYAKDLVIKESKSKMTSFGGRWKTQRHVLKYHSYWWCFVKTKNRVSYEGT